MPKKSPSRQRKEAKKNALNAKHEDMAENGFKPTGKSKYAKKAKRALKKGKVSANSPFKSL